MSLLMHVGRIDLLGIDDALHLGDTDPIKLKALAGRLTAIGECCEYAVVVTTHNPYLIDHIPARCVRMIGDDGIRKRLVDHPEWHKYRTSMAPGEFWSMVGCQWDGPTAIDSPPEPDEG